MMTMGGVSECIGEDARQRGLIKGKRRRDRGG